MDVEKLLGKLLHQVPGSGSSHFKKYTKKGKKKYKKKYKKKKYHAARSEYRQTARASSIKDSLVGNLTDHLTSGKGLLTAVGLGVGAYHIYQSTRKSQAQPMGATAYQQPVSPAPSIAPPPPPSAPQQPIRQSSPPHPSFSTSSPAAAPAQSAPPIAVSFNEQELARRLIRVMVGAAHADGTLDPDEEKIILDRLLRAVELDQEEKIFLLEELHHPRPIAELVHGIDDVRLGQAMYAVAISTITVDTESERRWLDELSAALGLSPELCRFIEESE